MSGNAIYVLYNLITITAGILLLNDIRLTKKDILRKLGEIVLTGALSVALFYLLMQVFNHFGWQTHYVSRIVVVVILSAYALIFSKYRVETKITAICVLYVASFQLESIRILLSRGPGNADVAYLKIIYVLIHTAIITVTALYIKKYSVNDTKPAPRIYCIVVLLTTIVSELCSMFLSVSVGAFSTADSSATDMMATMWGRLILGITFYAFNLLVYYMFYVLTTSYSRREEMTLLRQKQSEAVSELERANMLYDEISVLRHEYKNRILSMDIMLKSKQYDKLEKYFRSYISADAEVLNVINCGNRVLNSIFNVKKNDCRARGIDFDVLAAVPSELPFDDADMTSLLVNLIDNAMEATSTTAEPSVSVKMNVENNYCFITVINHVSGDVLKDNPKLTTTKKDKSVHGIGLRVVRSIVDKYNGHIKFEQNGSSFIISLMLEMQSEQIPTGTNGI